MKKNTRSEKLKDSITQHNCTACVNYLSNDDLIFFFMSVDADKTLISPRAILRRRDNKRRHENRHKGETTIEKRLIWTSLILSHRWTVLPCRALFAFQKGHDMRREKQSSSVVQQPGNCKWIADFNTLAKSSDSQTVMLFPRKVEFQVSSCVKLEVPEKFLQYFCFSLNSEMNNSQDCIVQGGLK